jgi:hypothetical protein
MQYRRKLKRVAHAVQLVSPNLKIKQFMLLYLDLWSIRDTMVILLNKN